MRKPPHDAVDQRSRLIAISLIVARQDRPAELRLEVDIERIVRLISSHTAKPIAIRLERGIHEAAFAINGHLDFFLCRFDPAVSIDAE